jgi:hypothetical protein
MKVFEEAEDSANSYFHKSLQELVDRSAKGAKEMKISEEKANEFVAEVYESYMTPKEMLELPAGDFFFFHSFFMKNVGGFMETFGWRYGQCFFNLLMDTNGRVGEMLRGSIRDPYHKDEVSEEVWNFLMDHWEG